MKTHIAPRIKDIIPLILIYITACSSPKNKVIETFENGTPKITIVEKEENRFKQEFYESGGKRQVVSLKDSVEHGKYTMWYESGEIWARGTLNMGVEEDTAYEYYKNGQLKSLRFYEKGTIMIYRKYREDGTPIDDLNFKTQIFRFWHENGQLKAIVPNESGNHIDYYSNGNVERSGKIKNGKKQGKYYYFNKNGDTLKTVIFIEGVAVDSTIYHEQ